MNYGMEELVPIVGKLVEKYTAYESTSVTYEKAEQFMGAVLYCIHACEEISCNPLVTEEKIPAQKAYETGLRYVEEKVKEALNLYNEILPEFCHYENQCLYDTFVRGIPEFFKWYDIRFEPQNTILTLDYPVLKDISGFVGIDRIYEFLRCIRLEQKFLKLFPAGYVTAVLSEQDQDWKESMDNVCEMVLTGIMKHILAGKSPTGQKPEEKDERYVRELLTHTTLEKLKKQLEAVLEGIIEKYYENDRELLAYLSGVIGDIAVRLNACISCEAK